MLIRSFVVFSLLMFSADCSAEGDAGDFIESEGDVSEAGNAENALFDFSDFTDFENEDLVGDKSLIILKETQAIDGSEATDNDTTNPLPQNLERLEPQGREPFVAEKINATNAPNKNPFGVGHVLSHKIAINMPSGNSHRPLDAMQRHAEKLALLNKWLEKSYWKYYPTSQDNFPQSPSFHLISAREGW